MGEKYKKASLKTRVSIYEFLRDKLVQGTDKLWDYKDDWTDTKVAAALSAVIRENTTTSMVSNVRIEMFGEMRRTAPNSNADLAKRVGELETLVLNMADEMSKIKLAIKFNPK